MHQQSNRLLALDVLRGLTVAGMILVNNPGSWNVFAPLRHAAWNGLTPTDLVFPFFMFIMGVSMFFSLRKYDFTFSKESAGKILKRAVIIFFISIGINWFRILFSALCDIGNADMTLAQRFAANIFPFENIRIPGVLQRLAISYFGAALISLWVKPKHYWKVITGILLVYCVVLFAGHGFIRTEQNVIGMVDRAVFGENHILKTTSPEGVWFGFDPEGLLSSLPCFAHVLIGMFMGYVLLNIKDNNERIQRLFIYGTVMAFVGLLFSYGCPINKKVWSPTFVLVACGFASQLLALLIFVIDIKGYRQWSRPLEAFGVNPLFLYVLSEVLAIVLGVVVFYYHGELISVKGFIYNVLLKSWIEPQWASLVYALVYVALHWAVAEVLYRKRIYIKI
ncbi:MAG: DUF5009 domain-containing protein [Odoribacter splanchnicus]|nr:DUF5009 domain-containing protein [Odoribacter splanchnicus]